MCAVEIDFSLDFETPVIDLELALIEVVPVLSGTSSAANKKRYHAPLTILVRTVLLLVEFETSCSEPNAKGLEKRALKPSPSSIFGIWQIGLEAV